MTSPDGECTSGEPEKRWVWPAGAIGLRKSRNGTSAGQLAIPYEGDIVPGSN
jgi:hypothetical protein